MTGPPDRSRSHRLVWHLRQNQMELTVVVGRISPEKRPDRAIEVARRAGIPLRLAAKVDAVDARYFREVVEPLLKGSTRPPDFGTRAKARLARRSFR